MIRGLLPRPLVGFAKVCGSEWDKGIFPSDVPALRPCSVAFVTRGGAKKLLDLVQY
jgi:hypothetical protein